MSPVILSSSVKNLSLQEYLDHRLLCSVPEHGKPPRERLLQLFPVSAGGVASLHFVMDHVSLVFQAMDYVLDALHGRIVPALDTAHSST